MVFKWPYQDVVALLSFIDPVTSSAIMISVFGALSCAVQLAVMVIGCAPKICIRVIGTVVVATTRKRQPLIRVNGPGGLREEKGGSVEVAADYVPVGAKSLRVADPAGNEWLPQDEVLVVRVLPFAATGAMLSGALAVLLLQSMSAWARSFRDEAMRTPVVAACAAMALGGISGGILGGATGAAIGYGGSGLIALVPVFLLFRAHRAVRLQA